MDLNQYRKIEARHFRRVRSMARKSLCKWTPDDFIALASSRTSLVNALSSMGDEDRFFVLNGRRMNEYDRAKALEKFGETPAVAVTGALLNGVH